VGVAIGVILVIAIGVLLIPGVMRWIWKKLGL
jgi:hypothetical protein